MITAAVEWWKEGGISYARLDFSLLGKLPWKDQSLIETMLYATIPIIDDGDKAWGWNCQVEPGDGAYLSNGEVSFFFDHEYILYRAEQCLPGFKSSDSDKK